jgi:hypothetical protein
MKSSRVTALATVAAGVALLIAGPLIPGGERLIRNAPPDVGHVTDLALADDGSVLAGTQQGELWRLADGVWSRVDVDLGEQPVTALSADLSGDPAKGPIGTGGGLVNGPAGMPALKERITDEWMTENGLVVATGEGLHMQGDGQWERALDEVYVYRLEAQTVDGTGYLHAGTIDRGVYSTRDSDPLDWRLNSDGLPAESDVFSFVVTAGGRLIAGTDRGLFWQSAPMQRWRPLETGLEGKRMLSMHLSAPDEPGVQQLWVGSDDGLWRVALVEDAAAVRSADDAELVQAPPDHVRFGVSWIVPLEDSVLFSAGSVYQYGPMGLRGWVWISAAGVLLILLGGWLFPGRETQQAASSR